MATTKRKTTARKNTKASAKKVEATVETKLRNAAEEVTEQAESMFETLNKNITNNVNTAQNFAKQLWFANLGIYGRVFEEVQTRTTRLNKERQELLNDLVSRGEKFQDDAEKMIKEGRSTVEEQMEEVRTRLTKVMPLPANMKKLSERIEDFRKSLLNAA